MGNFFGTKKNAVASAVATPLVGQQMLMSEYKWILRILFKSQIEGGDQTVQREALSSLRLRAQTLAPSRDQFRPLAKETMRYCLLVLGHATCRVRIKIYALIATLAPVLGAEMARIFPTICEHLEQDLANPHCMFMERVILSVLIIFAKDTGSAFKDHLPKAFQLVCVSIHNPDEDVRADSALTLAFLLSAFQDLGCAAEVHRAYRTLVPTFASLLRRDTRPEVVKTLCRALVYIYSRVVPTHSLNDREVEVPIFGSIRDLIGKQTASQRGSGQHVDDIALSGSNLMIWYREALDPYVFVSFFEELHGFFVQYLAENPADFFDMIDVCREPLDCRRTRYCDFLFSVLFGGIVETNPDTRKKAYYFIGELVSQVGQEAVHYYPDLVRNLLYAWDQEQPGRVRDNVSGAVARMIIANLDAVPLDKVLPPFMASLPIAEDFYMNEYVLGAFRMLYDNAQESVRDYVERILLISISTLESLSVRPECIAPGAELVMLIKEMYPEQFDKVSVTNPVVNVYMSSIQDRVD